MFNRIIFRKHTLDDLTRTSDHTHTHTVSKKQFHSADFMDFKSHRNSRYIFFFFSFLWRVVLLPTSELECRALLWLNVTSEETQTWRRTPPTHTNYGWSNGWKGVYILQCYLELSWKCIVFSRSCTSTQYPVGDACSLSIVSVCRIRFEIREAPTQSIAWR